MTLPEMKTGKTPPILTIKSVEVMADVRSAAWLEQELQPQLERHRRHQMADICERDNVEGVWRILGVAVAEVRLALLSILTPPENPWPANDLERPDIWTFGFRFALAADVVAFLKHKIHEYLVAAVMADRTAVIIPSASAIWSSRAGEALDALRSAAATAQPPYAPVRRPLWPML